MNRDPYRSFGSGEGGVAVAEPVDQTVASPRPGPMGSGRAGLAGACAFGYIAAILILLWSREFESVFLLFGGLSVLTGAGLLYRVHRRVPRQGGAIPIGPRILVLGALSVLAFAVGAGFVTSHRLSQIGSDWPSLVARRQAVLAQELERRTTVVLERGMRATEQAASQVAAPGDRDLFSVLGEVRARTGVDALALFNEIGELVAWAGDHRGPFPPGLRSRSRPVVYAERPLFSYLYFSKPVEGRGERVVAAILLQTGLPTEGMGPIGFAERFADRAGTRPFFATGPGGPDSWPLVVAGDTIAHADFEPVTQAEWRAGVGTAGRRVTLPLIAVAIFFLILAWHRVQPIWKLPDTVPLLSVTLALAIAPLGSTLGADRLFSPALFLLPIPPEISLGRLLVVLLPIAALAAAVRPVALEPRSGRIALVVGMLAMSIGFPAGLKLLTAGASPSLLTGGPLYWIGFQAVAVLVLSILVVLALPQTKWEGGGSWRAAVRRTGGVAGRRDPQGQGGQPSGWVTRPLLVAGGLGLSIVLAAIVLARWRVSQTIDPWLPALWALPFALLAIVPTAHRGNASRLMRWMVAGWLAASAVLPHLWVTHVEARIRDAERELSTLGVRPDPFLDYLLHQFAADITRRQARGEDGVALLYRSWVTSGLARESYVARIGLWNSDGRRVIDLPLGDAGGAGRAGYPPERILRAGFERARATGRPVLESPPGAPGSTQLLVVPLSDGRTTTVYVPPRRSLDRSTVLAPLLGADPKPNSRLTLIPAVSGHGLSPDRIQWMPTDQGWRSETILRYPDGEYHAHLDIHLPSLGVLLARGGLLLALDLGILVLLWAFGRSGRGEPPAPAEGWAAWARSFRSRVTLALFAFFLLPTILFGTLAYRALAGETVRTARVVAERAVAQAVAAYPELPGNWRALSGRIGEEVLYYHRGELAQASSLETVQLGIFGAWMPPHIYSTLKQGEEMSVVEDRRLGWRSYLVAYRRLPAGTLAVPISVSSAESLARQRDLADLVLFAVLVGGILSLGLSVAVGRTLARPIGQLQRASAAVGSGRLRVRLPETGAGEFGELFASFNRMVRRLRRARAQEIRAARVLAWGEMSRQVAHEIKNPLTPIKLSVQHLRRAYADGRPDFRGILDENVDQILKEIDRLTEIARAFSRYGAPPEAAGPLEPVDVALAVREALTLYRASEAGVHYWSDVEADLPPALARGGELKEVLLNLLENAHAALDGSGGVVVSARRQGDHIQLSVQDDGPGIPEDLLSQIFEPHFSTRSSGTGLGLAIVRRLVEGWGGEIVAESREGQGTTIRMRLRVATTE